MTKMKNILHAIDTGGPGGAETVFLRLAGGLSASRYKPAVAVNGDRWLAGEVRRLGLEPYILNARGRLSPRYLLQLIRIIRRHRIDIVQSHLFGSNVYCSLAGLICRVPVFSTFHGDVDVNPDDKLVRLKFRLIRAGSRKMIFVSEQLKKAFVNRFDLPPAQCVAICNGVPMADFAKTERRALRDELGLGEDDILVGAIGNIRPAKSYETFISAAARLAGESPRYKFVIAGQGGNELESRLRRQAEAQGVSDRLFFLGFRTDTRRILSGLDVFVQSSTSEGFSIAIVEAMACSLPVVATRSGGPEEILTHERDALMVDTEAPEQLAAAVERLAADPDLARQLAERARVRAESTYSLEAMLGAYESLYEAV